jgi:peroxiredoxin
MKRLIIILVFSLSYSTNLLAQPSDLILNPPTLKEIKMRKLIEGISNYDYLVDKKFADFKINDVNGKEISSKSLIGKITFINFWFNSCAPCHTEFEKINEMFNKYKNDSCFQIISFTFDSYIEIEKNSKLNNQLYQILSTSNDSCHKLNFDKGFPSNYIIDENGKVIFGHNGVIKEGKDPFVELIQPKINLALIKLKNKGKVIKFNKKD